MDAPDKTPRTDDRNTLLMPVEPAWPCRPLLATNFICRKLCTQLLMFLDLQEGSHIAASQCLRSQNCCGQQI